MRIGMNLFPLTSRGGGMRHYVMQLIPWLLQLSDHDLILFYQVQGLPSLAAGWRQIPAADRCRIRMVELDDQEQIFGYADQFDVYFCPLNGFAPYLLDRPTLGTLADIQDQYFPQYFTEQQLQVRRCLYPFMARAVTTLLTISEFSKRSICEKYDIAPSKVKVTYLAPSDDVIGSKAHWPENLPPLPKRYVFYPANLYPHKNHELLLKALRYVRQNLAVDCACVMTGHEANPGVAIKERIEANGLTGIARWLGYVPPGALRYLYEHAGALAFPSQFEGFGMPLVEAMQCGCPVIATPTTCIPEIVGDGALLVDGTPAEFGRAIARVLHEPLTRDELIAKGRARADRYTPRAMVEDTLAALEDAPAKFAGSRRGEAQRGISFVVRSTLGGENLVRTLASISFEANGQDEVIVLGDPATLSAKARALADNMDNVRFFTPIPGSAWLNQVRYEVVSYIDEGERLCPGAAAAAGTLLAERPACQAVMGQAIAVAPEGRYSGACFIPGPSTEALAAAPIPAAAVFWRHSVLAGRRDLLDRPFWTNRVAASLNGGVIPVDRTFATVHRLPERTPSLAPEASGPVLRTAGAPGRQSRSAGVAASLWSGCAQRLGRSKALLRRMASFLPRPVENRMRSFYLRRVQPYVRQR
jgi:glycosyltransferase involved in cell wall biosynthesis